MMPEYVQFLAFFLITVGLLKIGSSYFTHRDPSSVIGNGLAWFIP